ncbi:MAG: NAD(P)/FAD-dependent oxidoreductase [Gammaproteobacteria bacterium]
MAHSESRRGRSDVIVIGGGVVGLACAWYLLRAGRSVRLIEQRRIGNGSSFGNSGLITPSMAAPLPAPGVLKKLPRWLLDKRSPLYIKPRIDLQFLDWARRFAGFCNEAAVLHAMRARYALLESSRRLFDELIEAEQFECDWETTGLYVVYRAEEDMREGDAMDPRLEDLGISLRHVAAAELLAEEPALRDDVIGARFFAGDARLRPDRLLAEWLSRVVARGAVIEEGCELLGIVANGDRIASLSTSAGEMSADHYVLATGAWSPRLGRLLGLRMPIQAGKGYSLTMRRPERCPRHSLILKERLVSVTPWASGFRLGGTMEFAGLDRTLNRTRIDVILESARAYLTDPLADREVQYWYGWRPMTPDGLPLIGRSYRHRNMLVAAGHNMLGVSMSPGTGRLIAELVTRTEPHVDPAPYALERFR